MVAVGGDEDLRLVFQAPEGGRVDDAVAVALEIRARRALRLREEPPAGRPGIGSVDGALPGAETQRMSVECHSSPAFTPPVLTRPRCLHTYSVHSGKAGRKAHLKNKPSQGLDINGAQEPA